MAKKNKTQGVTKQKMPRKKLNQIIEDLIYLYDDMYFAHKTRDLSSLSRDIPRNTDKIGVDYTGVQSGERISFYYAITRYPKDVFIDFKNILRRECLGDTKLNFMTTGHGYQMSWDSPFMKARLRTLADVGEERDNANVNAYNLHANIQQIGQQTWIEDSLAYLADADKKRGRGLIRFANYMVLSGVKGEDFDASLINVETSLKNMGIQYMRIMYNIPTFLRHVSPFSRRFEKSIVNKLPAQVITDEILSRINTYSQGKIGRRGMTFGVDIFSGFPVLKMVKAKVDTAENWLITAETGGGKSFIVKALILQLLGLNYNGTIMDIEGFEYIPLANFVSHESNVLVINMAEGTGKYFDPVEIPEPTGVEDIDKDAKKLAGDFTVAIFKVLVGKFYHENTWADTILTDAVAEVYAANGVTEDRNTWINSKGLTLYDIHKEFFALSQLDAENVEERHSYRLEVEYQKALKQIIGITNKYFDAQGSRNALFSSRINIADIKEADLVVCSFGMAGKSPQAIDQTQVALMQLSAAMISHQRSIFSWLQGKYNFKLWEEFQRWGKFPDSEKTIGVALTGGRKLGDVNIILTNVVADLLNDDRFGLFGNITSFMCGAISDSKVRTEFLDRLSIPQMLPELDLISKANKIEEEAEEGKEADSLIQDNNPYLYSFLCGLDRAKYTVVKMKIPKALRKTDIFTTGVTLEVPADVVDEG